MSAVHLDALAMLDAKATPGPWSSGKQNLHGCTDELPCYGVDSDGQNVRPDVWVCTTHETENPTAEQDTALIATMRNQLGAILAELRAAREVIAAARRINDGAEPLRMQALNCLDNALRAYDEAIK